MSFVLSKRQIWMVDQVTSSFGLDREVVEKVFRDKRQVLSSFLSNEAGSPKRLFFFFQKKANGTKSELFIMEGTVPCSPNFAGACDKGRF